MQAWPAQTTVQHLPLWVFWTKLPSRRDLTEADVNRDLQLGSTFGDHVLLRRSLIDAGLISRTQDGSDYRRIGQIPPSEALGLIHAIARRPRNTGGRFCKNAATRSEKSADWPQALCNRASTANCSSRLLSKAACRAVFKCP